MINNNIYALLIGVGDYKKIKIADLPSYRMDVALIGTGLISGLKCTQEHIRFMAGEDNNAGGGQPTGGTQSEDAIRRNLYPSMFK